MLKKLALKSGVNQENTRYTSENGYYEGDKIRFRQGTPEKIGGWELISLNTFLGVCRSLFNWITIGGRRLIGVGTHLKFYIEYGSAYYDITPIRSTTVAGDVSLSITYGSDIMTVTDVDHGCITGDFVTFSNSNGFGGNVTAAVINQNYQVTVIDASTYTVTLPVTANAEDTITLDLYFSAGTYAEEGADPVIAAYEVNVGEIIAVPTLGWGATAWGYGTWGIGDTQDKEIRIWNQSNYGNDLIFGPRGGGLYYWYGEGNPYTRGVALSSLAGANAVPVVQNIILVSDASRFVFAFGCNEYGLTELDPMLIRWSDQESAVDWGPAITNQAGSIRLSQGSKIVSAVQSRQEILVWTDTALYSLQYQGPPYVWGSQLLEDNISIVSQNAAITASGVAYWMGDGKFYKYDGRVQTMRCDLRQYVFNDINFAQYAQIFCGTNEEFNEVWWFYCSENSDSVDRYVVYNYAEDIWYYGTMARTAWLDSDVSSNPLAACYNGRLVYHEYGLNDNVDGSPQPIESYILSAEFDIDDGHNLGFVWRMLPDITFRGSLDSATPQVTMTLYPMMNSGSGYNSPTSVGGSDSASVARISTVPIEQFTGQVYIRVRGRQMAFKVYNNQLNVAWQLGSPRIDIRPDGRR